MLGRLSTVIASTIALLFIGFILALYPTPAHAVGTAADAICSEPGMCQYGTRCGEHGPPGVLNKPCSDGTNGFTTSGKCVAQFKCLAQSAGGNPLTDISQLMQGIQQLMQAMQGQGGGGGGGGSMAGCTTYTATSSINSKDPCTYYVASSDSLFGNSNTSGSITTGTDNGSSAASSLISSLFGSNNSNSNSNTSNTTNNTPSNVSDQLNGNTNTNTTNNTNSTQTPTPTQSSSLNPGTNATKSQVIFGSSPGIAGDIQILTGNQITVLASNRDVTNGRQTTGFYGFAAASGATPNAIYTNLCATRPWASNFLSFIMPSNYLDSLCTSHGFSIAPPPAPVTTSSVSSSGSIVPKAPAPAASSTPVAQYIGPLRASIWAVPPSVSSGSRTSIFWDSSGALSCAITSNDNAFTGSSLSGHNSSQPLTKNTTFSINCQSATSTVSNQVVVTVQ